MLLSVMLLFVPKYLVDNDSKTINEEIHGF